MDSYVPGEILNLSGQPTPAPETTEPSDQFTMSKEEMLQIIESQKREINLLQQKLGRHQVEKEQIIDNFKMSSGVLLERIKDLEANQTIGHERPQTACVLNNIQGANSGRIGEPFYAGTRGKVDVFQMEEAKEKPAEKSPNKKVLGREREIKKEEQQTQGVECPNCHETVPDEQAAAHTIQCYRNSTKCRICGEIIQKHKKQAHLAKWRDIPSLIDSIKNDDESQAAQYFDHGIDPNLQFQGKEMLEKTPMHIAAENGSMQIVIGLISRGAGVDPTDMKLRTPLTLAIENNKFPIVRSLIELGADIEQTDQYGRTPVMHACMLGSKPTVELLIQFGADLGKTNQLGEGCMPLAQKSKNQDLIMLLVKHGGSLRPASAALKPLAVKKPPPKF